MMFLDNQQIDADLLNGIAKDLGATDFSAFTDGERFGVDKLNEITKALVTSGVISNADGTCKVTVSDGTISVGTGTIVFNSGAKLKITENQTLELIENTKTYVIAVNDTTNNRMLLYNLEAEPTEDDYVLLAEVSTDGKVTQNYNRWAFSKALSPQNTKKIITLEDFTVEQIYDEQEDIVVHTIPVDLSNYKSVCLKQLDASGKCLLSEALPYNGLFYYDLESGGCIGVARHYNAAWNSTYACYRSSYAGQGIPIFYSQYGSTEGFHDITVYMRFGSNEIKFVQPARAYRSFKDTFYASQYTLELL